MLVNLNGGQYGGTVREVDEGTANITIKDDLDRIWHYTIFPELNEAIFSQCELPLIDKTDPVYIADQEKKANQEHIWNLIKEERDRLKFSGVKVGQHWFHSDPNSRNQQLGLFTAAIAGQLPQNVIMWKTLTPEGGLFDNVEVPMNNELAIAIFTTTMTHDATFHYISGVHRHQLLLAEDPLSYDYKTGWPESFESYQIAYLKANA
jgi:hypothetical protein